MVTTEVMQGARESAAIVSYTQDIMVSGLVAWLHICITQTQWVKAWNLYIMIGMCCMCYTIPCTLVKWLLICIKCSAHMRYPGAIPLTLWDLNKLDHSTQIFQRHFFIDHFYVILVFWYKSQWTPFHNVQQLTIIGVDKEYFLKWMKMKMADASLCYLATMG